MIAWAKYRGRIVFGIILVIYISLNFATTHIEPQGSGELTGLCKARVYDSECHLAIFYPVCLIERWIRNGGPCNASYNFGCEIKDKLYAHFWMYYDDPQNIFLFFCVATSFIAGMWKFVRFSPTAASVIGFICASLIVLGMNSYNATEKLKRDFDFTSKHFGRSILWLKVIDVNDNHRLGYISSLHSSGGRTSFFGANISGEVYNVVKLVGINSEGFKLQFRQQNRNGNSLTNLVDFPYGLVTKTNWNQFRVEGEFPWYKPDIWVPRRH